MNHPLPCLAARHAAHHRAARGFTLVENLICLALLALLTLSGLAAMRNTAITRALEGTAALLETDLRYARSLALVSDRSVRFQVLPLADGGTCYLVYSGPTGSCSCGASGPAQCQGDGVALRAVAQPGSKGVRVLHSGRALVFDAGKGTVTPTATLVVSDDDGLAIHQIVNLMGRTRTCSPQRLAGWRSCS